MAATSESFNPSSTVNLISNIFPEMRYVSFWRPQLVCSSPTWGILVVKDLDSDVFSDMKYVSCWRPQLGCSYPTWDMSVIEDIKSDVISWLDVC